MDPIDWIQLIESIWLGSGKTVKIGDVREGYQNAPNLEKPGKRAYIALPLTFWEPEWVESGKHYIQYVSHQPASRVDVARLREMLDQKLMERQARESGICPVREELFSQCFDEIIRQVTLNEPERGLLLLRVRDEIKMTIAAYQTLYQR